MSAGWWRRNRWGLAALPLVLAAALAASSSRVGDYWWLTGSRVAVRADQGDWVDFTDSLYDRSGDVPISLSARLVGVHEATVPFGSDDELVLPPGTQAMAVELEFSADPDTPLRDCMLRVLDAAGTEYAYLLGTRSFSQASAPCVPPDTPGPWLDLIEGLDPEGTESPRPPSWQTAPVVVLPVGVEITEVRLSWGPPRYLAFEVS